MWSYNNVFGRKGKKAGINKPIKILLIDGIKC
jgi:hypothetical protein